MKPRYVTGVTYRPTMTVSAIGTGLESLDELFGGGLHVGGVVGIVGPRSHQLASQIIDHASTNRALVERTDVDEDPWVEIVRSHRRATVRHTPTVLLLVGNAISEELRRWSDLILQLEDWDPELPFVRLLCDDRVLGPGTHLGWFDARRVFVSLRAGPRSPR